MDGENKGNPYFLMDDLGGFTTPIFGSTPMYKPVNLAAWVGLNFSKHRLHRSRRASNLAASQKIYVDMQSV